MKEIDPQLLSRLDALAAKLGTTAEHLWTVGVRGTQIEGILWSVFALLGLAGCIYAATLANKHWAKEKEKWSRGEDGTVAVFIAATLASVLATLLLFINLLAVLNPEYVFLKSLMRLY